MEIKFIGTGSGKTSLKRFHSSFLINSDNYNLLVDAGDAISRALLNQKVLFNFINGILISHLHPDHYSGLPALIVQMKMFNRTEPLFIFCHESNKDFLKEFIYQSYLFEERLGFKINIDSFKNDREYNITPGLHFTAKQNTHLESHFSSDKSRRLNFSCCSFLLKVNGKSVFYSGDIGQPKDLFLFQDEKTDWMISEITHITADELVEAFRKINPDKLFITHLSEEDEEKVQKLSYQLPVKERQKIISAFDGLSIKI